MSMVVILGILLVLTAIYTDEKVNAWYQRLDFKQRVKKVFIDRFTAWGEKNYLGSTIKEGLKVKAIQRQVTEKNAFKQTFEQLAKNSGIKAWASGDGSQWWPFYWEIAPEDLHAARMALRAHFGSWNDEIEPGECRQTYDGRFVLQVTYRGKGDLPYHVALRTEYDLENLPKGLLKETCKVVKEEKVTVTCSVVCSG